MKKNPDGYGYEVKIRGIASDLVRAEFDDVHMWDVPAATCFRTQGADAATLFGLMKRIDALGLVLLEVRAVGADDSGDRAPPELPGTRG